MVRRVADLTFFDEGDLVAVLTTEPLGKTLDYKAPEGGCFAGAFVEVPLGPRRVLGVVWGPGGGTFDPAKIRPVTRVLDAAPMGEPMRNFMMRTADYTLTPMPAMLRLATRAPGLADPPGPCRIYRRGGAEPDRLTEARARVMEVLADYGGAAFTLSELAGLAGVTTSVVKGLVKQGAVTEEDAPRDLPYPALDPDLGGKDLAEDQDRPGADLGTGAMTLAQNFTTEAEVDAAFALALKCGAKALKRPQKVFWGGYSGYYADPDGHVWELAMNPFWPLAEDGSLILPEAK